MSEKGTLYGVSVGPGAPGQMTLEAVKAIIDCPVIAAPRTKSGEMLAFRIAQAGIAHFLGISFEGHATEAGSEAFWASKTILPLSFPMSKDPEKTEAAHRDVAEQVREQLDAGKDVAMLNLGDVSVYSTYHYIAERLEAEGYPTKMLAGVTSFCASAAALNLSLTGGFDTPIFVLPGALDDAAGRRMIAEPGTKVLMKTIGVLPETIAALKQYDLAEKTSAVVNCGLPDEQIYLTLADFEEALANSPEEAKSYYTTLIVKE